MNLRRERGRFTFINSTARAPEYPQPRPLASTKTISENFLCLLRLFAAIIFDMMTAMKVWLQHGRGRERAPMLRRLAVGCLLLSLAAGHAPACTLWGEAGTNAAGG